MKEEISRSIELSDGVTAQLDESTLTVKGPKGEVKRQFLHPRITITAEGNKITLSASKATKREKTLTLSFESHIKNMVQGVQEPHEYKLKVCSGHFPMNVSVSGLEFTVKNFLGEAVPRKVTLPEGIEIKVDGDQVIISSPNIELAGQAAAKIESLCRITNRDRRIFQDGIYITQKAGKVL